MSDRKEVTVAELAEAVNNGLEYVLNDIEVKGIAVIKDKDGNIKGELSLSNRLEDK